VYSNGRPPTRVKWTFVPYWSVFL